MRVTGSIVQKANSAGIAPRFANAVVVSSISVGKGRPDRLSCPRGGQRAKRAWGSFHLRDTSARGTSCGRCDGGIRRGNA
jgi:hypothetical protein